METKRPAMPLLILTLCLAACLICLAGPADAADPPAGQPAGQGEDPWAPLFPNADQLEAHRFATPPVAIEVGSRAIPKDWFLVPVPDGNYKRVEGAPAVNGAERLASLVSPQGLAQGLVEVLRHDLDAEVDASDWLLNILRANRVRLLKTRAEVAQSGPVFEVLGLMPAPAGVKLAEPLVTRVAVYRSGQSLYVVRALALRSAFAGLAYDFAASTLMFKIMDLKAPELVGAWREQCLGQVCYTGPGAAEPVQWPAGRSIKEYVYTLADGGRQTGSLHVKAVLPPEKAKTDPLKRIPLLVQSLAAEGYRIAAPQGVVAANHVNMPEKVYYFRGRGADPQGELVELFAFSTQTKAEAILVWMLTADAQADVEAWMRNKRAFEIVCSSLHPTGQ